MAEILLSSGDVCRVDERDYHTLSNWKWKRHPQGYASRTGYSAGTYVCHLMHRYILDAPEGMEVHHVNGDKLDNRRANLELVEPKTHRMMHVDRLVQHQKKMQIYPDVKKCANCGTEFNVNPRKRKRHKCCSQECAMEMRIAGRRRQASSPKSQPKS